MYYKTQQVRPKYRNIKQTFKGNTYDSKAEAGYAMYYDNMLKKGEIKGVRRQVRVPLVGEKGTTVAHYKLDFVIDHLDGTEEYVEVKGFETSTWRLKFKMLEDKFKGDATKKITLIKV